MQASKLTGVDLQIVSGNAVFRGLKTETVAHMIAPATAMRLRARETFVRQDDAATAFFIVIGGWIKLFRSNAAGDEAVLETMTSGGSFAEAVSLTGNRYLASAEAVTDARVARIPADHLIGCLRDNPDLSVSIIASICQHMHQLVQRVERLKALSGVQRLAEFLLSLTLNEDAACALMLPYDKALIASELGLTPESLSRAFAKLRGLGVTVEASQVTIRDVAGLRKLATDGRSVVRGVLRPPARQAAASDSNRPTVRRRAMAAAAARR